MPHHRRYVCLITAGNVLATAIGLERPAVVAAAQYLRLAGFDLNHFCAFVRATIEEQIEGVFVLAHEQNRLARKRGCEITAFLRNLALVGHVNPCTAPDPFHLELENLGIGVDRTVNAFSANHCCQLFCVVTHQVSPASRL